MWSTRLSPAGGPRRHREPRAGTDGPLRAYGIGSSFGHAGVAPASGEPALPAECVRYVYRDKLYAMGSGFFQYDPDEFYVDYTAFRLICKSPDRFNFIECYHPYWRSNDRTWQGLNSPLMQWAQHKGTAIALFNIPAADPWAGRGRTDWQPFRDDHSNNLIQEALCALSEVDRPEDRGERLDLPAGRRRLHRHPSAEGLHDRRQLHAGWGEFDVVRSAFAQTGFIFDIATKEEFATFEAFQSSGEPEPARRGLGSALRDIHEREGRHPHGDVEPAQIRRAQRGAGRGSAGHHSQRRRGSDRQRFHQRRAVMKSPSVELVDRVLRLRTPAGQLEVDWRGKVPEFKKPVELLHGAQGATFTMNHPTIREEGEYRSLAGLPSYDLQGGVALAQIRFENNSAHWLSLTVSRDVREPVTLSLTSGDQPITKVDAGFVSAGQRLRIPLDAPQVAKLSETGSLMLKTSARLWIVAPNESFPRLGPGFWGEREEPDFLARLQDSTITQFGWMHGCVLDALFALDQVSGKPQFRSALKRQLEPYLTTDGVNYEGPRNQVCVNNFPSIELTLPVAVIAQLHPDQPAIDHTIDFLMAHRNEDGLIQDGQSATAEGCYTIAYPLMVIGRQRGDSRLVDLAFRQLTAHRQALWTGNSLYLRSHAKSGRRTFQHWARGICWYFLGHVRTVIAHGETPTADFREHLEAIAAYVAAYQNEAGLWHNFIEDPGQLIDTSGSAGIACALALCANRGWIDASYQTALKKPMKRSRPIWSMAAFSAMSPPTISRAKPPSGPTDGLANPLPWDCWGNCMPPCWNPAAGSFDE